MESNYYCVIPADILRSKDLTDFQKMLFVSISGLCNQEGYCWATNEYFAEFFEKSKNWISNNINVLEKKGFISIDVQREKGNRRILKMVYLSQPASIPVTEKEDTYNRKVVEVSQKNSIPITENCNQNNINNNIYKNNNLINNTLPVFSENEDVLTANAVASSQFEVNTISSFSSSENLNQELTPLKSQNSISKPKESGSFSVELMQKENELTVKPIKDPYPCEVFKRLWVGYSSVAKGKQGGKDVAFKAWLKVKNKASPQDFEKAIAAYSLSKRVKDGYIQNFATFLNSGQWQTELDNGSQTIEEEKRRASGRSLKEQIEAQLEEEYKAGTRRRP